MPRIKGIVTLQVITSEDKSLISHMPRIKGIVTIPFLGLSTW